MAALNILGLGVAYPSQVIDKSYFNGSDRAAVDRSGINQRLTTVNPNYLRTTQNSDPANAISNSEESPTDLAVRAANSAMLEAGIEPESLGLLIGDCSTPWATTPSEAQRLGGRYDLKVPAFDVTASSGVLCLHFETLANIKEKKLPDYVLCVSTNTPSQRVDYSKGTERFILGDAAVAVVVSPRLAGKAQVIASNFKSYPQFADQFILDSFDHAHISNGDMASFLRIEVLEAIAQAKIHGGDLSKAYFIGPQILLGGVYDLGMEVGVPADRQLQNVFDKGYSLGSSEFSVLADHWTKFKKGDQILITSAGAGLSVGYTLIEVV